MDMNIGWDMKRKIVLVIYAVAALSLITLFNLNNIVSGLLSYNIMSGVTLGSVLGIIMLYFIWLQYNKKFG